jgi:hypothetical protein
MMYNDITAPTYSHDHVQDLGSGFSQWHGMLEPSRLALKGLQNK